MTPQPPCLKPFLFVQNSLVPSFSTWQLAVAEKKGEMAGGASAVLASSWRESSSRSASRASRPASSATEAENTLQDFHKRCSECRVELVVTTFARVVDWVGIRSLVLGQLDLGQRQEVERRIGAYNLFHEAAAVDHWTLELSRPEDRRILQELIHLGDQEPGRNFVDVFYNDIEFNVPAGWLKSPPDKGTISLHYCREKDTCRLIKKRFEGAWPEGFSERHGVSWVQNNRIKLIKLRLRDKFPSGPKKAFRSMDRDGGGTMDRGEFAVALLDVGCWLHPKDIELLMGLLDADGSGEIDEDEFTAFWNAGVDLDEGLQSAPNSPLASRPHTGKSSPSRPPTTKSIKPR